MAPQKFKFVWCWFLSVKKERDQELEIKVFSTICFKGGDHQAHLGKTETLSVEKFTREKNSSVGLFISTIQSSHCKTVKPHSESCDKTFPYPTHCSTDSYPSRMPVHREESWWITLHVVLYLAVITSIFIRSIYLTEWNLKIFQFQRIFFIFAIQFNMVMFFLHSAQSDIPDVSTCRTLFPMALASSMLVS